MVASDGSGLAALALPDDPAAGAHFGFTAHSVSLDGRWLAYSPRPPRNSPDTPPGQTVYLKDLFGSQPARAVAQFSRIWPLDVSPGGKKMIVNGTFNPATEPGTVTREHYLVDVDTGSAQELPTFSSVHTVDWSPTGEHIAALSDSGLGTGPRTLKFFAADGTELLSLEMPIGHIAWSRDGTRLALAADTGTYIIDLSGAVHHVSDVSTSQWLGGISWSPDGNRIALTYYDQQTKIGVLDVATGQLSPLAAGESPSWSRNGTQITYTDEGRLRRVDTQTGEVSQLVSAAQPLVAGPHWIADDAGVVFRYAPQFLRSIRTANPDGTNEQHIAYGDGPAWSPDGRQIAFVGRSVSFGFSGYTEIYVMNVDGSSAHKVATVSWTDALTCPAVPSVLAWSEDGARVLYYDQSGSLFSVPATGDGPSELVSAGCPSVIPTPPPDVIPSPAGDRIIIVR
jgi:Tol biopolymer transport system component